MRELVIVGAGDHARVAHETAQALGLSVRAFVDSTARGAEGRRLAGIPVSDDIGLVAEPTLEFIVAIGASRARADLFDRAVAAGGRPATLVHPTAVLLAGSAIGPGSHVCARAIVGLDARIGRNVIVNTAASLDHDVAVGDHAFIGPGAVLAGRVSVGAGAHLGIGSVIIEGRTIGEWSLVAAGATVIRDVGRRERVAGVPARPMRDEHSEGTQQRR